MKMQTARKLHLGPMKEFRMWAFFGVLLTALICSAVVGTRTVRASSCTSAQCSSAFSHAYSICQRHGGMSGNFVCPFYSGEADDYFFQCIDNYVEIDDCGTNNPS